jgi:hypothetical protein
MPKGFSYLFDPAAMVEARLSAGLSVVDVSEKTGYNVGGIRAAENRNRSTMTNRAMLNALAALYDVEPYTLVRTKHRPFNGRPDAPTRKTMYQR